MYLKDDVIQYYYLSDMNNSDIFSYAGEIYTVARIIGNQVLCCDTNNFLHYFYGNTLVEVVE